MNTNDAVNKIFSLLDDWRNLPSYQLERRADIFFALYLKEILAGEPLNLIAEQFTIIPEFPVLTDADDNRSFKIDYAVFARANDKHLIYFIELKTEQASFSVLQQQKMENSIQEFSRFWCAIEQISKKSYNHKHVKWNALREKLKQLLLDYSTVVPELVFILPSCPENISRTQTPEQSVKTHWIPFKNIIDSLRKKEDDGVRLRFIDSLEKWDSQSSG